MKESIDNSIKLDSKMNKDFLGLRQDVLTYHNLGMTEALLIDWFLKTNGCSTNKRHIVDGQDYYNVQYEDFLTAYPILGIENKESLSRRFNNIVKAGFMEKRIVKKGGTYVCFRLNYDRYKEFHYSNKPDYIPIGYTGKKAERLFSRSGSSTKKSAKNEADRPKSRVKNELIDSKVDTKSSSSYSFIKEEEKTQIPVDSVENSDSGILEKIYNRVGKRINNMTKFFITLNAQEAIIGYSSKHGESFVLKSLDVYMEEKDDRSLLGYFSNDFIERLDKYSRKLPKSKQTKSWSCPGCNRHILNSDRCTCGYDRNNKSVNGNEGFIEGKKIVRPWEKRKKMEDVSGY